MGIQAEKENHLNTENNPAWFQTSPQEHVMPEDIEKKSRQSPKGKEVGVGYYYTQLSGLTNIQTVGRHSNQTRIQESQHTGIPFERVVAQNFRASVER